MIFKQGMFAFLYVMTLFHNKIRICSAQSKSSSDISTKLLTSSATPITNIPTEKRTFHTNPNTDASAGRNTLLTDTSSILTTKALISDMEPVTALPTESVTRVMDLPTVLQTETHTDTRESLTTLPTEIQTLIMDLTTTLPAENQTMITDQPTSLPTEEHTFFLLTNPPPIHFTHHLIFEEKTFKPVFKPYTASLDRVTTVSPCIKDPLMCKTIDQFRRLCPLTDICQPEVYEAAEAIGEDGIYSSERSLGVNEYPCCANCSCDKDCGTNCCPDKPTRYLNQIEIQARKDDVVECVLSQYRPYVRGFGNLNSGEPLEMIAKCPSGYTDALIRDKCLRDYFDFDFQENLINLAPVTSNTSYTTYKNRHCALCHDEDSADLVNWNVNFQCHTGVVVIMALADIQEIVTIRPDCNVDFTKPPTMQHMQVNICENIVDTCNKTGEWKEFDPDIEAACMSYRSTYMGYQNIHCYLCNGFNKSDINEVCYGHNDGRSSSSFVALLDFNNLEDTKEIFQRTGEERCQNDEQYDYLKKTCAQLFCSVGLIVRDGACVPVYKTVQSSTSTGFEITITLQPLKRDDTKEIVPPIELQNNISYLITEPGHTFSFEHSICDIQTFVQLKRNLSNTVNKMIAEKRTLINSDISYIAVIVHLDVNIVDVSRTIESFETILDINNEVTGGYKVVSRRITASSIAEDRVNTDWQEHADEVLNPLDRNLSSLVTIPSWLFVGFVSGYNRRSDNKGVLHVSMQLGQTCTRIFQIERNPFCSKVRLLLNETTVNQTENRIYIPAIDNYMDIGEVIFEKSDTSVLVCSTDYMSMMKKYLSVQSRKLVVDYTEFSAVAILTIICISLSLLALIVTFAIYCIVTELRTLPGLNNMSLTFCLFVSQASTLINTCVDVTLPWLCSMIGAVQHVSLLSSAFCMFVCTFHMMRVFVTNNTTTSSVNGQTRTFLTYVLSVTIATALVVAASVAIPFFTTESSEIVYGGKPCYIKDATMIVYAVAVPIGLVVVTNIIMFLSVVIKISRLPDMKTSRTNERRNITIFVKLSSLTGLTWTFGFIFQFSHIEAFAYIFILLNASQGIFVMFSFVVNRRVFRAIQKNKKSGKSKDMSYENAYAVKHSKTNFSKNKASSEKTHSTCLSKF